ncbi:PREDICTED: ETS-like protein pointed, isoform P1 [Dufourea novaeangliae]|uniref:ETS-like protein pointed, isoform P1 n=1 Tax=Dufourea novaeangliae TaxID=178035 RepID=UPI000767A141|nr:PREDICTED: ETS-like protein pointed, isoform P1 [Dufourea novaeangliae]
MAGKPEQPSTHPAPPKHSHHHQYHQHHQQQQQQDQQQQQQPHRPQHAHGIQQNSVLVYVSGENFAYATAVGQNAAAAAAAAATAVGYQSPQQATYTGILPPQVATAAATFPAKTAIYCNDNSSAVGAAANNCCRLKPLQYVSSDGDSSRSARILSTGNVDDEEDYGTIVSNNGLLYRQTNFVQATSTAATTTMTCVVSACDNKNAANRSSLDNDTGNTDNLAANNVESIGRVNGSDNMVPNKLFPSRIHGEIYPSPARLTDGYNNNGRIAQRILGEGCVGLLSDDATCVAYVRQGNEPSQTSASVFQADSGVEQQRVDMDEKSRQQDAFQNQAGSSLSSSSSSVGVSGGGGGVVVVGNGGSSGAVSCDSVRSDTGESSTYSSLSSPESQSQSAHDGLSGGATVNGGGSCAQQAARQSSLSCINNSNNDNTGQQNVVLTMNGSAVVTQQQQQQHQQAITVPREWKRICTNGVIIYIR